MKKPYSILIIILLISCQEKDWKTNLSNEIFEYENTEKIENKYSIKHNSGNDILIEKFKTNTNGIAKLYAIYKRPEFGDWEKSFFTKNGKVFYSRNFGIAPVQNLENDTFNRPKYFFIERKVWFENDSIGIEEIKELEMFDLKNIELKKAKLLEMEFITSELNNKDYRLIENDFKALTE